MKTPCGRLPGSVLEDHVGRDTVHTSARLRTGACGHQLVVQGAVARLAACTSGHLTHTGSPSHGGVGLEEQREIRGLRLEALRGPPVEAVEVGDVEHASTSRQKESKAANTMGLTRRA